MTPKQKQKHVDGIVTTRKKINEEMKKLSDNMKGLNKSMRQYLKEMK